MVQRILERGEIETLDHSALPRLHLPVAAGIFASRASRLRKLAANQVAGIPVSEDNASMRAYLLLMATVADAQQRIVGSLSAADLALPENASIQQSLAHAMPPLSASGERPAIWTAILFQLLDSVTRQEAAPHHLHAVLQALRLADKKTLEEVADAVLTDDYSSTYAAQAPFIAAALQTLWVARAAQLDSAAVPMLETFSLCPVCGSHPVASVIRIGGQSQGYRYLHCSLCASEWHMVRVKCSCCEENGKISYQSLDKLVAGANGSNAPIQGKAQDPKRFARAETCDDCQQYRKVFNQEHDYNTEPLADDLASLTLDLLVSETGYARASFNPLLWFAVTA